MFRQRCRFVQSEVLRLEAASERFEAESDHCRRTQSSYFLRSAPSDCASLATRVRGVEALGKPLAAKGVDHRQQRPLLGGD